MQQDLCDKHNEVKRRKPDGSTETFVRCANPSSPHFTKVVERAQCRECPYHLAWQEAIAAQVQPPSREDAPIPEMPSLIRRAVSWSEAVAGWATAGCPERTDEQVQEIYEKFCKPCAWRDPAKDACRGCGCNVKREGVAIFNKIKMATQHCPRGLW